MSHSFFVIIVLHYTKKDKEFRRQHRPVGGGGGQVATLRARKSRPLISLAALMDLTIFLRPLRVMRSSAVYPSVPTILVSAPCARRCSATSVWPFIAATCRGVWPSVRCLGPREPRAREVLPHNQRDRALR